MMRDFWSKIAAAACIAAAAAFPVMVAVAAMAAF